MENSCRQSPAPWNKGRVVGHKLPLELHEIWEIRGRLQMSGRTRDLALFNLATDSKLRGHDLVRLRLRDVAHGEHVLPRTMVIRRKTARPVQFQITENTRDSIRRLVLSERPGPDDHLFRSRFVLCGLYGYA